MNHLRRKAAAAGAMGYIMKQAASDQLLIAAARARRRTYAVKPYNAPSTSVLARTAALKPTIQWRGFRP